MLIDRTLDPHDGIIDTRWVRWGWIFRSRGRIARSYIYYVVHDIVPTAPERPPISYAAYGIRTTHQVYGLWGKDPRATIYDVGVTQGAKVGIASF